MIKKERGQAVTYVSLPLADLEAIALSLALGSTPAHPHYKDTGTKLEFSGEVVSKERPRSTANGHTYTPKKTVDFEKLVAALGRAARDNKGIAPYRSPVVIHLEIRMAIAASWSPVKKALAHLLAPSPKDMDNMEKAILDGLNGVSYFDDVQIIQKFTTKKYSDRPGFTLHVAPVGLTESDVQTIEKLVRIARAK